MITIYELRQVFRIHHYDLPDSEINRLYGIFLQLGMDRDEVYKIIEGANKKAILLNSTNKFVKADLNEVVENLQNGIDRQVYLKLSEIDRILKSYYAKNGLEFKHYSKTLKNIWKIVKNVTDSQNLHSKEIMAEDLNLLEKLANLYAVIVNYVPNEKAEPTKWTIENGKRKKVSEKFVRVADYIISARLGTLASSTIYSITNNISELNSLFEEITSERMEESERFLKEDIYRLIDKSAAILSVASKEKYLGVKNVMLEYFNQIKERNPNASPEKLKEVDELTAKSVMLNCISLMKSSIETFKFTSEFLLGSTMSTAIKKVNVANQKTAYNNALITLAKEYPDLKLNDMTVDGHLDLIKNRSSMLLNFGPISMLKITDAIADSTLKAFGIYDEKLSRQQKTKLLLDNGFDINAIYTQRNYPEIFTDYVISNINGRVGNNIYENTQTLLKYIKQPAIQKIMATNFSLFAISNAELENDLNKLKEESNEDIVVFNELFNDYINTKKVVNSTKLSNSFNSPTMQTGTNLRLPEEKKEIYEMEDDGYRLEVEVNGLEEFINGQKTDKEELKQDKVEEETLSFQDKFDKLCFMLLETKNITKTDDTHAEKRRLLANKNLPKDYIEHGQRNRRIKEIVNLINEVVGSEEYTSYHEEVLREYIKNAVNDLSILSSGLEEGLKYNIEQTDAFYMEDFKGKEDRGEQVEKLEEIAKISRLFNRVYSEEEKSKLSKAIDKQRDLIKNYPEERRLFAGMIELYGEDKKTKEFVDSAKEQILSVDVKVKDKKVVEKESFDEDKIQAEINNLEMKRQQILKNIQHKYGEVLENYGEKEVERKNPHYVTLKKKLNAIEENIEKLKSKLTSGALAD